MSNLWESLSNTLGDGAGKIIALVPIVAVVLVVAAASRLLNRQAGRASGVRFRNQLIAAGLSLVGLLVIIIILPVDPGVRGQLLTLVGIIISVTISLSSSTFLGNAMAGVMLKTVRNFRSGDFIKVGDHFGRVTERGLFHTEIQTATRDLTTLPNLYLATTPVQVVRSSGTIVDATVSLGYDISHDRIESLLLNAAQQAELAEPFVQVLDLGDYAVTYRVAGLLSDAKRLLTFRSRLRAAMLDSLHQGGVEIVSPKFVNIRDYDPKRSFVPEAVSSPPPNREGAPLEVVFDKAEEAASLSSLRQQFEAVKTESEALAQQSKKAETEAERAATERKAEILSRQLADMTAQIEAAEAKEKARDD